MNISLEFFAANVAIRARVAFCLAVAESVLIGLRSNTEGYLLAQEALNAAWKWQETSGVSGDTLAEYLDSYSGNDLGDIEAFYEDNELGLSALIAVGLAVGYAAHYAYRLEGDEALPQFIEDGSEDTLIAVVNYASKTNLFDPSYVNRIVSFLLNLYKSNLNDYGTPVSRDELLNLSAK